jgi:predicted phosphodiesterase
MNEPKKVRIAALADCHYRKTSAGHLKDTFVRASETADVLVVCGDMTDYGLSEEAAILAQDIKAYVGKSDQSIQGISRLSWACSQRATPGKDFRSRSSIQCGPSRHLAAQSNTSVCLRTLKLLVVC